MYKINFKNPPPWSKVHTWWHWMQGSISKDGISKYVKEGSDLDFLRPQSQEHQPFIKPFAGLLSLKKVK